MFWGARLRGRAMSSLIGASCSWPAGRPGVLGGDESIRRSEDDNRPRVPLVRLQPGPSDGILAGGFSVEEQRSDGVGWAGVLRLKVS